MTKSMQGDDAVQPLKTYSPLKGESWVTDTFPDIKALTAQPKYKIKKVNLRELLYYR